MPEEQVTVPADMRLITPHGDRKLAEIMEVDVDFGGVHLITPHGDRKRSGLPSQPTHSASLITPHGDRKPWFNLLSERLARVSLPLMGIGNHVTEALEGGSKKVVLSLPLMGIGNLAFSDTLRKPAP